MEGYAMKKRYRWLSAAAVLAGLLIWLIVANKALVVTEYTVVDGDIPEDFHGFRIAHISDLHNESFGQENGELLERLERARPDIIVITGDLVDSRHTDIAVAVRFAEEAARIAPTYYVMGNHEARISGYRELLRGLECAGVIALENESIILSGVDGNITLTGVQDPSFQTQYLMGDEERVLAGYVEQLQSDSYQILLSHRPEYLSVYADHGVDLVFSGHAHGGQIRIPFVGGLVAPGQGLFPKYDAGVFTQGDTTLIVSRGLGNSIIPLRINNRPEIVIVTLNCT
jgi:predicted MPP superfamily phosphohydrolase